MIKKFKERGLNESSIQGIPEFNMENFLEKINLLENQCKLIETQDMKYQTLMKNQLLVTLVSVIEHNLKAFFSYLIDKNDIHPKNILLEDSIEINLDVLKQLSSSDITKGRIITAHLNTLKPAKLYPIMSRINKLDYFEWVDRLIGSSKTYVTFRDLHFERNNIIHNLSDTVKSTVDLDHTIATAKTICTHIIVLTQLNLGIFEKNWSSEKINVYYNDYLPKAPIPIEKFKTITKEFRDGYVPQNSYFKK